MALTPTVFRVLLVSSFLVALVALIPAAMGIELLSPELVAARDASVESVPDGMAAILLLLGLPVVILGIASNIGLLFFKHWSRPMALVATLLSLAFLAVIGPEVMSGLEVMLDYASAALWGACLAIAYWSPLSERFLPASRGVRDA